jgi:predicted site-specific integrase-resolvase
MEMEDKRYYTEKEFCQMMGISRKTAFEWREKKMIGYIRTPSGIIRYRKSDIEKFEKRNEVKTRAA